MPLRPLLLVLVLVVALAAPLGAGAVVPPKDCGTMRVEGKRYQVKVDQIRCRTGKRYATRYLKSERRPSGYTCRDYASRKNRVRVYCNDGRKVFFAIRR